MVSSLLLQFPSKPPEGAALIRNYVTGQRVCVRRMFMLWVFCTDVRAAGFSLNLLNIYFNCFKDAVFCPIIGTSLLHVTSVCRLEVS